MPAPMTPYVKINHVGTSKRKSPIASTLGLLQRRIAIAQSLISYRQLWRRLLSGQFRILRLKRRPAQFHNQLLPNFGHSLRAILAIRTLYILEAEDRLRTGRQVATRTPIKKPAMLRTRGSHSKSV